MVDGKRGTAQRICYDAFEIIKGKNRGKDAVEVFNSCMENVMPVLEVKARRGAARHTRFDGSAAERRQTLAIRWLALSQTSALSVRCGRSCGRDHGCCKQHRRKREEGKICTRWRKRTRRSRTIAGKHILKIHGIVGKRFRGILPLKPLTPIGL